MFVLVNKIGSGQAIDFDGAYLTGNKVQPIAFSTDLSRAYVAGKGTVYEIDLLTFQLIDSIVVPGGKNIVSLASVGSLLIVGEGQSYGNGAGNNQLYAMDTNPGSSTYKTFKSIQGTGIEDSKLGVAGMTVGPDGQTLVVAVPQMSNTVSLSPNTTDRGNILILDFKTFNFKTGAIAPPLQASLPNDSLSGKAPQVITATHDENRYLVANVSDYNRGLSTLTLIRDADGNITGAKLEAIPLAQPTDKITIDRLDIQRAQSAVLVEQDGVEYAIVSDDNYHFLDTYWKAMYEAPTFVFTPSGPPLAVGGSASAKKVAVGGKLGIVKDPFGKQGSPEYLGATLPLDGYGIVNLSLSEDGKVLIGQLKGTYGGNILSEESLSQKPSQSHAWDVKALIAATLAQTNQDRLRKHISLTATPNAEQNIANPGSEFRGTIGTAFDGEPISTLAIGNMGDVIAVDLKRQAAIQLLLKEKDIPAEKVQRLNTALTDWPHADQTIKNEIEARKLDLFDFEIDPAQLNQLKSEGGDDSVQIKLMTDGVLANGSPKILSRQTINPADPGGKNPFAEADFNDTGIVFFIPNIRDTLPSGDSSGKTDIQKLLAGETLGDKYVDLIFTFKDRKADNQAANNANPGFHPGTAIIIAKDYAPAANAFVGDRPLDNPGYSAFQLKGGVDTGVQDLLDVNRVEQRLKYLGFAATDSASGKPIAEIAVDGKLNAQEQQALKLFEKIVRYTAVTATGEGSFGTATVTVDYRASVTSKSDKAELEEVPGSFKLSALTPNAKVADIKEALKLARTDAQNKALSVAGFKDKTDNNGMDGIIESASGDNKQRDSTINWLNAYNAPHWMRFFDNVFGNTGYELSNARLEKGNTIDWINQQTTSAGNVFGTSWTFDLMQAGSLARSSLQAGSYTPLFNEAGELVTSPYHLGDAPLLFNGTGDLGLGLKLGINSDYVSIQNQKSIDGDEKLFGLMADHGGISPPLDTGSWNFGNAMALSGLLVGQNRTEGDVTNHRNQGPNNQASALNDFLTLYTATQNDSVAGNGSLNEITMLGGGNDATKNETIRKALFGDGTQANGLINKDNLLVGGLGANNGGIGAQLTAESLAAMMSTPEYISANGQRIPASIVSPEKVVAWVDPLNDALKTFEINTPREIAAFLANVKVETGGLAKFVEGVGWSATNLKKVGRFSDLYTANNALYNQYVAGTVGVGATRGEKQANYAYANDDGNGGEASRDGYNYRGRGIIQITRQGKYDRATNGGHRAGGSGERVPGLNEIYGTNYDLVTNYESVATDKLIAARTGAWYWRYESSWGDLNSIVNRTNYSDLENFKVTAKGVKGSYDLDRGKMWSFLKDVVYDQNAYGNMSEVLHALGIQVQNKKDYNTQFGITLNKPTIQNIVSASPNNLIVGGVSLEATEIFSQNLFSQVRAEFDIQPGETDMLFMDMPNVPPQQSPVIIEAKALQTNKDGHYGTVGVCIARPIREEMNPEKDQNGEYDIAPRAYADNIFSLNDYPQGLDRLAFETSKISVLQAPKHGTLSKDLSPNQIISYYPNAGYIGKDKVVLLVDIEGYKVKVVYFVEVVSDYETGHKGLFKNICPDETNWFQISTSPTVIGLDSTIANLADGAYSLNLPAAFLGADYTSPVVTFANLTGAAVGETKGEGANAIITLDTNAVGHGWYIDYTPYLNDGFLPTSNPNEWVAKTGSEAAGKMDLLSVLLHEYGHALGLEHSANAHDFMGTTLTPGTRRLPSADELTLMAQLVAEAKQNLAGLDGTAVSANGTNPTPSPIPTLPLGAGFGIAFLGLTRRKANSTAGLFEEGAAVNAPARYDTAANPALVNSELNSLDGWETTGNVAVNSSAGSAQAGGAAVLSEAAGSQTRLNQVFVLGEHDRFLSFTVANAALGDQASGPDDAFEAALLDANTGLSLLGATGLSRNDAFLNLQANGEEHKASGITRIDNVDGSRTYLVDLGGIAAGTAVNLSFDLIGFGQGSEAGNSRITVRDLRLGVPQTADDSATLNEDTPTVIDALANDINAFQPGFIPVIVNAPSHGQVTINPSNPELGRLGSFSYTPDKDWYGEDSFSYKLSDSRVDSNLATVTLTVTPVNDAPVAADTVLTLAEDATAMIDLLSLAVDVESSALASAIVSSPAHGSLSQNTDGSWIYTPDANYNGSDSFTYKVNDGELDSNLATVMLTIVPVNDAPIAGDQQLTTDEDTPISGSLLAVATDIDSVLLQGSIVAGPQHGQVSVASDGSFTYLADENYNGADSFTYKVNDGELDSAVATVMLTILPVNDAPVVSPIAATLLEDGRITLNLLGSASDVDGDPLSVNVGTPQHGQLIKNADGSYTYLPQADYNGEDSFSYSVSDGQLDSGPAIVRLTLTAVNDAPVAQDDTATLDEDHSIQLAILANDVDVDSNNLNLVIVSQPQHGQLIVNADQTVSYTPLANWSGEDSFSYKLNDGELDSGIATVRLIVNPVADAPALVLSEVGGARRELFRSGWESVGNRNANSTLLEQRELEGWTVVAQPEEKHDDHDDYNDHDEHGSFEVWSSGDLMRDVQGRRREVNAAGGNGNNWLELNDAKGEGHETLGIERRIDTVVGASYTLSLDLAGQLGYVADSTRIGIYLDGIKIGGDDSTSPSTALNWQTRTFQFTGTGGTQTIRIVSEANRRESNGRGMMLDNIALTETLQANTGFEDGAVPLSAHCCRIPTVPKP